MTLRTRLALVLVALVMAPLLAAAILVLYAVPRAAGDRADSLVVGALSGVTDELSQQCGAAGTAAEAGGAALTASIGLSVEGRNDLSQVRTAQAITAAQLDDLRNRLGLSGDIVLLLEGRVVASTSNNETDVSSAPDLVTASDP